MLLSARMKKGKDVVGQLFEENAELFPFPKVASEVCQSPNLPLFCFQHLRICYCLLCADFHIFHQLIVGSSPVTVMI